MTGQGGLGATLANVRPGERGIVLALSFYSFFLGTGMSFFMSAAYALFLTDFSARELPFVYITVAATVPLFGALQGAFEKRVRFNTAQLGNVGFMLMLFLVSLALLAISRPSWLVFLLPVMFELQIAAFALGFWPLASRLFDVQQAKRLFPMLGSGSRLGAITGGLGTIALIDHIGATGLIAITAGCYLVGLVSLAFILARNARTLGEASRGAGMRQAKTAIEPVRSLFDHRFIRLLILFAALPSIAYNLIDFLFLEGIELRFETENALASFLGGFRSVLNLALLVSLLFIGGRLMNRYGVRFGLMAKPLGLLVFLAPAIVLGLFPATSPALFWILVALKFIDVLMRLVFEQPATHVLKLALPEARLVRVNRLVESGIRPVMNGVGGLAILGIQAVLPSAGTAVQVLLIVIVLAWLIIAKRLSAEYGVALAAALKRHMVGLVPFTIADATTAHTLRERATGPNAREAVYALRLLEDGEYADLESVLAEALQHTSADVREYALAAIERHGIASLIGHVKALVSRDPSSEVRARALRAQCVLEADTGDAHPFIDVDDIPVRAEALALLVGDIESAPNAVERLTQLMADEDPRVRRLALIAAGHAVPPALLATVADHLRQPADRRAAVAALAETGDSSLVYLEPYLEADSEQPATMAHVVHACARIGTETALATLARHLDHESGAVRRRVIEALRQHGYAPRGEERAWVLEQFGAERDGVVKALEALRDLRNEPGMDLLTRGLASHVRAGRERIFGLLSLLGNRETVISAELGLRSASPRNRALARELLETSLPAEYAGLMALLTVEDTSPAKLYSLAEGYAVRSLDPRARLTELTRPDVPPWLRTLATMYATNEGRRMETVIEKVMFLKATPIFSDVDEEDLEEIAAMLEPVELRAGETVFEQGEPARYIFFIADGHVEFRGPQGLKKEIGQGDCFGDIPVLARIDYIGTAVCMDECRLLRIDGHAFADLLVQNGAMAYGIIRQLLERVMLLGRELGFELPDYDKSKS